MKSKNAEYKACFVALCIALFVATGWMLSTRNGFLMDDYTNLIESASETFSLLPRFRYNDRPTGRILLALLRPILGTNAQGYHLFLLGIHLANVFLAYRITKTLFSEFNLAQPELSALLVSAIFGAYSQSIMAPQWIAAILELCCCFFCLCGLYYFLKKDDSDQYMAFYGILSVVSYILALRSKEMPICLPLVFVMIDLARRWERPWKERISLTSYACLAWMVVYAGRLMTFPGIDGGAYQQSFSPLTLISNLFRYVGLYVDIWQGPMVFGSYTWTMLPGAVLLAAYVIYALWSVKEKKLIPLLALVSAGLLLAPVLTMSNMQHKLYLYIPALFLAVGISAAISQLWGKRQAYASVIVVLILAVACTNYLPGAQNFRYWWTTMCAQDAAQLEQIAHFETLPPYCTVYVRGAETEYNVIHPYGPGNSVKFIQGREDLTFQVVDEFPDTPAQPYAFWEYAGGIFSEAGRDGSLEIVIQDVFSGRMDDETMAIGVVCTPMLPDMTIQVNGVTTGYTTIGDTFISTTYPRPAGAAQETVLVTVSSPSLGSVPCREAVLVLTD